MNNEYAKGTEERSSEKVQVRHEPLGQNTV